MGLFEHFPYTNLHDLNLDWILRKLKELETTLSGLVLHGVPAGGTAGQVLTKASATDYDAAWEDPSSNDYWRPTVDTAGNLSWALSDSTTPPEASNIKGPQGETGPAGQDGTDGQDGAPGVGVPSGGSQGQVLTKASATDYDTTWTTPSGGGGGAVVGAGTVWEYRFSGAVPTGGTVTIPQATIAATISSEGVTYGILEAWIQHTGLGGTVRVPIVTRHYVSGYGDLLPLYFIDDAGALTKCGTLSIGTGQGGAWEFEYASGVGPYASLSDTLMLRWFVDHSEEHSDTIVYS